jgi:hypothetical protein
MQPDKEHLLLELLRLRTSAGQTTTPAQFCHLWNSVSHGLVALIRDRYERLAGYVIWANFSKESISYVRLNGKLPSAIGDWSEGKFLFVLDMLVVRRAELTPLEIMKKFIPRRKYILFVRKERIYVLSPRAGLRPVMKQKVERSRFPKKIVEAHASGQSPGIEP